MTVQERMEEARRLLEVLPVMGRFISPIQANSLKNRDICGVITGYSFGFNNLSYRGIWLSTFEDIHVKLDGKEVPQGSMVLSIKGMKIPVRDLEGHSEVFWGAEDACSLLVYQLGGLAKGKHKVAVSAGDGLKGHIILRGGKHILALNAKPHVQRRNSVIHKIVHAKTTPFRLANWPAVTMISLVSCRMSSLV